MHFIRRRGAAIAYSETGENVHIPTEKIFLLPVLVLQERPQRQRRSLNSRNCARVQFVRVVKHAAQLPRLLQTTFLKNVATDPPGNINPR